MMNYFIILGLSFEPIEENEKKIIDAIEKKTLEWQNEAKNPKKQVAAKEKIAKIPDIKKVLLDPQLRKQEAEKAILIKQEQEKDLKNELIIIQTKGYITPAELKEIHSKYKIYGFNEESIKKLLTTAIEVSPIEEINDDAIILDHNVISQLTTHFNNLGIDDYSIYNYLDLDKNTNKEQIIDRCNNSINEMLNKGEKSNTDETLQKLFGLFIKIFSDDKSIIGYNNYLLGCQYKKINNLIKTGIKTNNSMTEPLFQALIKICINDYAMTKKYAVIYIINNIKINKYDVNIEEIRKMEALPEEKQKNILSEKEEQDLIRKRIIEEEKIKNEIAYQREIKQQEAKRQEEKNNEFKKQYKEITEKITENLDKQENFLLEKIDFMVKHSDKRIKNSLAPSKAVSYILIILFIISSIVGGYFLISCEKMVFDRMLFIVLACISTCLLISIFYFYISKMWENCQFQQQYCIKLFEKYNKKKQIAIEVMQKYNIFTENAKNELVKCEADNNTIFNNFINEYNLYIKYNNKAKFKPWIRKLLPISLAGNIIIILLQFIK